MALEEAEKPRVPAAEEKKKVEEEAEEAEIVEEAEGDEAKEKPTKALTPTHPLEHSWTFWFDNPSAKSKQVTWGSSMPPIYTFSTVEEFWSLYNTIYIIRASWALGETFTASNIKLSRNGRIQFVLMEASGLLPSRRENPIHAGSIRFALAFELLAMIGEQFDHGDEICGVVVNVRSRQEKIALWTKNAANEAAQVSIGR